MEHNSYKKMIKLKFTEPATYTSYDFDTLYTSNKNPFGNIKAEIEPMDLGIEFPYELPLLFQVVSNVSGNIVYSSKMFPGCWASCGLPDDTTAFIKDHNENIIAKWEYDPLLHGDVCAKLFMCWCLNNRGAKGIAIGTYDGSSGEWVSPLSRGLIEAYLVEASDDQYKKLERNYEGSPNCKTIQRLITTDGKDCEFFESGDGASNSVFKSHVEKNKTSDLEITLKKTTSLNDLIIEIGLEKDLKWLHLDVEGLDSELIMSLDKEIINLPDIIIYESLNLSQDVKKQTIGWLEENGYSCKECGWNTIAHKTNE
jgi:FkbM family methyltransferase